MAAVTLVRRLSAVGALWIVLAAATAPAVAAGGLPGLTPDSDAGTEACSAPLAPLLPCVTTLPPVPVPDPPLLPDRSELVPTVLTEVDEIVSSDPLPVSELLGSVPALVVQPAGGDASGEGATPGQPAADQPALTTVTTAPPAAHSAPAARGVRLQADADPTPRRESATLDGANVQPQAVVATVGPPGSGPAAVGGSAARLGDEMPVPAQPIVVALLLGGGATLAVELARGGSSLAGVVVFNVWLRRQLRETRMSQRQLAAFSGVDHSTISRLMSGEHEPSLATATKLVEALRKLGGLPHAADYFARLAEAPVLPAKRVEAALLGDEELDDEDVRELMHAYLLARARRRRERRAADNGGAIPSEGRTPA
jgi:transcriptional regulator with XRE-family HTH domain